MILRAYLIFLLYLHLKIKLTFQNHSIVLYIEKILKTLSISEELTTNVKQHIKAAKNVNAWKDMLIIGHEQEKVNSPHLIAIIIYWSPAF